MDRTSTFDGVEAELTEKVIKVFYAVANELGYGFLESVYRKSLLIALVETGLQVQEERPFAVSFHDKPVGSFFADLVVEERLILELKASDDINPAYEAQLLNYLRCSGIQVGLVLAFGKRALFKRVVLTKKKF